jgi:hypothetical protein
VASRRRVGGKRRDGRGDFLMFPCLAWTMEEMEGVTELDIDSFVGGLILPGDIIGKITDFKMRLGPGLMQNKEHIVATKCGVLRNPQPKYYWIENNQKRVSVNEFWV